MVVAFQRVTQRKLGVELIGVASPGAGPLQVARFDEVSNDPLGRTFGDADPVGKVAVTNAGIASDAEQHMGVVGQERPTRHAATIQRTTCNSGH